MTLIGKATGTAVLSFAIIALAASVASAQLQPPEVAGLRGAPFSSINPPPSVPSHGEGPEWDGRPPDGLQPLPVDVFTTTDFYKDRDLWMNPLYWRCNSPRMMADLRSGGAGRATTDPRVGSNPPVSARWGDCNSDWPRENIVSPYPFSSAEDHYGALMADAESRGGPTAHTYETMPKWDGTYRASNTDGRIVWNYMRANQMPTILSLLTPEHRQRMVQQIYHEGVDAAHQWSASYCWPEGFMRQWATGGTTPDRIVVTPEVVLLMGDTMTRVVHLNREFPVGPDVPQWYGDTIGFWDGDALITWTSNVQGWNQHSSWEWSDELGSGRDLYSGQRCGRPVHRARLGGGDLRFRGDGRTGAAVVAQELWGVMVHGPSARKHGMYPPDVPYRRARHTGCAGGGHRVPGSRHDQPPVGRGMGIVLRTRYGPAPRGS